MKATIEVPDDLYRLVKARSALEGRAVRAVAVELFRRYVEEGLAAASSAEPTAIEDEPAPFSAVPASSRRPGDRNTGMRLRLRVSRAIGSPPCLAWRP